MSIQNPRTFTRDTKMRWLTLLAAWAGILSPTATPQGSAPKAVARPLGAETFAKLPFVEQAALSPDGNRIAGLFGVSGQQAIGIIHLSDATEPRRLLSLPDGTQAGWIRWVNDDNVIIGVRMIMKSNLFAASTPTGSRMPVGGRSEGQVYVSRFINVNRVTGQVTRPLWSLNGLYSDDIIRIDPDGRPEVLVAAQESLFSGQGFFPSVYRVDVETEGYTRVLPWRGQVVGWAADAAGQVRAGVAYDPAKRRFRLVYRSTGTDPDFREIDRADTRERESLLTIVQFVPDSDRAVILREEEDGRNVLLEHDLATSSDGRRIFETAPGVEITEAITARDGRSLLGVVTSSGAGDVHWLDPTLAGIQQSLERSSGGQRVEILSLDALRRRILVRISQPHAPGALFLYDVATRSRRVIAQFNEALRPELLAPVKTIRYTARDGLPIEAVLTLPPRREAKALPVILLPHGGPWAQDVPGYDYWAQFFAAKGYAVLQPNFRGSTGYGSSFTAKGEGQLGLAMQDDLNDSLQWAVSQGIADARRACIVGASYGGYAAMWSIARDPDLFRCAISIAGVADLRREVNNFGSYYLGGKYRDDWERMTPDFPAVSPLNAIPRIKAPLLLVHGKKDLTVDHGQSSRMHSKMKSAGKDVEFLSLPQADHYFTREADRLALLQAMERFLDAHNPAER